MEQKDDFFEDVKRIIIAGAKSQPRSVLQTFRGFINRWDIAQIRQKKDPNYKINHKMLAVILVLQNNWPELFLRIVHYPEHLFFIHALVKNRPSAHCTILQLDEINNFGMAVDKVTAVSVYDVRYQREIVRLFNAFNDDKYFDEISVNDVIMHITLVSTHTQEKNLFPLSDHIWETLRSGDPVRINNLQSQGIPNSIEPFDQYALDRLNLLSGELEEIRRQQNSTGDQTLIFGEIERLLVALGIIKKTKSIYKLDELIIKNANLPLKLKIRCIYVLAHHAKRGDDQALHMVLKILDDAQCDWVLRVKIAYLLRYINLYDDKLDRVINVFDNFSSLPELIFKDTLRESLVLAFEEQDDNYYSSWGHNVIGKISLGKIEWKDLMVLLEEINSTGHYWRINTFARYLLEKISKEDGNSQFEMTVRYFSLLQGYMGKDRSSDNEKEVLSEFMEIMPFADPNTQEKILMEALEIQYGLQLNSEADEWWDSAWYQLLRYLSDIQEIQKAQKDVNFEWPESLRGLRTMDVLSPLAVNFVRDLYKKAPDGWTADLGSTLIKIRNNEILDHAVMHEEMQTLAQKACDELKLL